MSRGIDCNEHEKRILLRLCKKLAELGLETKTLENAINTKNIDVLKTELKRLYKNADFEQKEKLEKFATMLYILKWK